jgi:tRNA uridine 5-carboxymethylaminomethyl modification enzyme
MFKEFDVIVVGGGHAGCEAAHACAAMGSSTLLITQNLNLIAQLSCNPAMGGVAKGQIVREIDALGGMSGIITDANTMQFRMLNLSKGPAMFSPRAQVDDITFPLSWRNALENTPMLSLWQDEVTGLVIKGEKVCGVKTRMGLEIASRAVVLTNGTFLNGRVHIGETNFSSGRIGEMSSFGLSEDLKQHGFSVQNLKTGTPMRVDKRSIDFTKLTEQQGDQSTDQFSFLIKRKRFQTRNCFIAYTSKEVHDILRTGFDRSPMFQGRIKGRGPRYCPSIEDKIERFASKDAHQLFIEPESRHTNLYYVNGFSSSLPLEVQYKALRHIVGFENAIIQRPGYAIEYDYFSPLQLKDTLETKIIQNLYFAGQINGTTGYEEAACQGLMAGINAHLKIHERPPFVLKRDEAYIGVLIDDLITKGVDEPYRMFTSRAEYRILLRQDDADARLTPLSYSIGLASAQRMRKVDKKNTQTAQIVSFLSCTKAQPQEINSLLESKDTPTIQQKTLLSQLLLRPQISLQDLTNVNNGLSSLLQKMSVSTLEEAEKEAEILIKYQSYIDKEKEIAQRLSKYEDLIIKDDFNYNALHSLSFEAREKLSKVRPKTIGQASRISGVSPSDISVLILYIQH